jgi:ABC-type uncharacterized transport system permease subunit
MEPQAVEGFAVQFAWLLVFGVLAVLLRRRGLLRYTAVGG